MGSIEPRRRRRARGRGLREGSRQRRSSSSPPSRSDARRSRAGRGRRAAPPRRRAAAAERRWARVGPGAHQAAGQLALGVGVVGEVLVAQDLMSLQAAGSGRRSAISGPGVRARRPAPPTRGSTSPATSSVELSVGGRRPRAGRSRALNAASKSSRSEWREHESGPQREVGLRRATEASTRGQRAVARPADRPRPRGLRRARSVARRGGRAAGSQRAAAARQTPSSTPRSRTRSMSSRTFSATPSDSSRSPRRRARAAPAPR